MTIFVNYRREDSQSITGRIDEHLRRAFGDRDVFRDIDSIPAGVDFAKHLQQALHECEVCVAILGVRWISKRLEDENDFVRVELEAALSRGVPIIPVLVEGANLPKQDQIPNSLHDLLKHQALRVDSGADFKAHVQRLVLAIQRTRTAGVERAEAARRLAQQHTATITSLSHDGARLPDINRWTLARVQHDNVVVAASEAILLAIRIAESAELATCARTHVERVLEDCMHAVVRIVDPEFASLVHSLLAHLLRAALAVHSILEQPATTIDERALGATYNELPDNLLQLKLLCLGLCCLWCRDKADRATLMTLVREMRIRLPADPFMRTWESSRPDYRRLRAVLTFVLALGTSFPILLHESNAMVAGLLSPLIGCGIASVPMLAVPYLRQRKSLQLGKDWVSLLSREAVNVRPDRAAELQARAQTFERGIAALSKRMSARTGLLDLPCSIVIGPPGAGKTTAFRHALTHPLPQGDSIDGPGDARWWLTTQGILIDVPPQDVHEGNLTTVLQTLRRHAGRNRALANITLVVPTTDLQHASEESVDRRGKGLRQAIEEVVAASGECPPIDLLVTKLDLLGGFRVLWGDLRRSERHDILGRLIASDGRSARLRFRESFADLGKGMRNLVASHLAFRDRTDAWQAVEFAFEFEALRPSLEALIEGIFPDSPRIKQLPFRGFYFTSAEQGKNEFRSLNTRVEQMLGSTPPPFTRPLEESRTYFIANLMRMLILR